MNRNRNGFLFLKPCRKPSRSLSFDPILSLEREEMDAAEERIVSERLRRKLNDVNVEAQNQLSGIQDHVNFTLQKAYFRCAHECFDRRRQQEEINNCVENCSVPVVNANNLVQNEMAKFQANMITRTVEDIIKVHKMWEAGNVAKVLDGLPRQV
ncbi:uncharacterized protein LOC122070220 isoform X2 [Macadamia integrifolia]|uniref:uncharacterized protein LOC122070220 isoform X2 n=1 Tax=Macadamia integrifolia TaxID=60698 RepID=UPI001C4F5E1D|nr:uncharacterized protein LOC122070220 isoform X2 [Macadamia integrifolia]